METTRSGKESPSSASAIGVSQSVGPPSGSGMCGLNSITNVIHGGVTATVLSSFVPRLTPHFSKKVKFSSMTECLITCLDLSSVYMQVNYGL